jgi:hypothetical protein
MGGLMTTEKLHGRDRVAQASATLHDLGTFAEETLKGSFTAVESRLQILQVRCHEVGGDIFEACREILTRPEASDEITTEVVGDLRARASVLRAKATHLPAGECGPLFKDANLMDRAASRIEQLDGTIAEIKGDER